MKDLKNPEPVWQAKYTWQAGDKTFLEAIVGPQTRAQAILAFHEAYPQCILLSLYEI